MYQSGAELVAWLEMLRYAGNAEAGRWSLVGLFNVQAK